MTSYRPINAVLRSIDILQAMNLRPVSSVELLHRETSIPKPTIVRILETLCHCGLVRRGPARGSYHLTNRIKALSAGYHSEPRLIEAAAPIAIRLTQQVKWPVAITTMDIDAMAVQYSTIPLSPMSPYHSVMNVRYSLVRSANGRAYLAFCTDEERELAVSTLEHSPDPVEAAIARDPKRLEQILAETRRLGYALRDPETRPESYSIAAPIMERGCAAGTISLTWYRSAMSIDAAVARYAGELQAAAAEIAERLRALGDAEDGDQIVAERRR